MGRSRLAFVSTSSLDFRDEADFDGGLAIEDELDADLRASLELARQLEEEEMNNAQVIAWLFSSLRRWPFYSPTLAMGVGCGKLQQQY